MDVIRERLTVSLGSNTVCLIYFKAGDWIDATIGTVVNVV